MGSQGQEQSDETGPGGKAHRFAGAVLVCLLVLYVCDDYNRLEGDYIAFGMITAAALLYFSIRYTAGREE